MNKFILNGNNAFSWIKSDNYYFIGYCFDDDEILTGDEAIKFILNNLDKNPIFNGIYSLISIKEKEVEIIVDSVNYFPIFFLFYKSQWIISDSWDMIVKEKNSFIPNKNIEAEFINAGFVLGYDTIDKEIKKTKSGAKIILGTDGNQSVITNWSFFPDKFFDYPKDELIELTFNEFKIAQNRMIRFLDGRTAVLPLSGGFDSRLIACMLKDCAYPKVICFTYGKPNAEERVSKKVAAKLGFEWHFINYEEIETTGFIETNNFNEYAKLAGNGFSMPYLQEYFAVKYLKENQIIPEDSVFLPGHSGDFLGGSYISKTVKNNIQNNRLAEHLRKKYFWFFDKKDNKAIEKRITENLDYPVENIISNTYNPYIENWDIKEKLAKFIFHSSIVFNHFGYELYFPLWDINLLKHFRKVPFELRENKTLYDEVLVSKYFNKYGVCFDENELIVSKKNRRNQKLKDSIRHYFPWSYVLKRMAKNDWMHYSELCKPLEIEITKAGFKKIKRYRTFNAIICKWYLVRLDYYKK
ncbi:MAG: asparagine synthase C-terminal domain-containing protein [Bacteroidales bacterium]|nr:asparagine synthase C-terminal domain-containing protein [Bacteroidales bacterium]